MALFENFPYTNFHDMNMDWLLKKVKELSAQVAEFETLLENGPVADVKTQRNGAYTTIKGGDGIALLPGASDTTAGVVTMDISDDSVRIAGTEAVELPVLTDGMISAEQIPVHEVSPATSSEFGTVKVASDTNSVTVTSADGAVTAARLTDGKIPAGVIPASGITSGTYGGSPSILQGTYAALDSITVDTTGRVTAVQTTSHPVLRCSNSTIAAGDSSATHYFNSTAGPWYNQAYWMDVQVFKIITVGGSAEQVMTRLKEGTDYTVVFHSSYAQVTLVEAQDVPVYVKWYGVYGEFGH